MPSLPFYTLDSFAETRFAGNPAGVVFHDGSLSPALMQTIAGELHLETAFLSPPQTPDADFAVAYYTGMARVPLCGHDTVAAATVLLHDGRVTAPGSVRFSTDIGLLKVDISASGDITMTQALPTYGPAVDAAPFAPLLGAAPSALTCLPVQAVSTGTSFVMLGVAAPAILHAISPNMTRLDAHLRTLPGAPDGLFVWTPAAPADDFNFHARCFAPGVGLPEDPVTGSASGAFGCYAVKHGILPPTRQNGLDFRTEQGRAMGRVGHAQVSLDIAGGSVSQVRVTGRAVPVSHGTLYV